MKKTLLTLFAAIIAVSAWAYTLPESTMDLKAITASTMGKWQDAVSYELSENYLVVSGYASYKSVGNQKWITQSSVGNSSSTWNSIEGKPFKGSSYYTTGSYTTIQNGRNLAYRVKNCKSVMVYGKNNSTSKYLKIFIYEVTDGTAAAEATYTLSDNSTSDEMVWSQSLDGNKEYIIDIEGVGSSNSRVFEVAFERNVVADNRKDPKLSLSGTEFTAHVGDTEFAEPTVYSEGGYTGSYIYSSDKPGVASVDESTGEVTIVNAGKATITIAVPENDANYKPRSVTYTITVMKSAPVGAIFYESFDKFEGQGGNDGKWSGTLSMDAWETHACDNEGWTTEGTMMEASECACMRKVDANTVSGLTTPAIGVAGAGKVQFNAESWGTDGSNFFVDIIGGGTFVANENLSATNISNEGTTAKVAMTKTGTWTTFTLSVDNITAETKFRFYAPANKRAFLDEVAVFVSPLVEKSMTLVAQDGDGYYATFSSDKATFFPEDYVVSAVGIENGHIYTFDNEETFDEDIVEIDGEDVIGYYVPANTGVLVYSVDPEVTYYKAYNVTPKNDVEAVNMLCPASKTMEGDFKFYKLAYNDYSAKTGLGFYYGADEGAAFTCKAGTAYLAVPAPDAAKGYAFDGTTTAISNVATQNTANSVAYNLAGQRVNANQKGIVIVNGMKRINK